MKIRNNNDNNNDKSNNNSSNNDSNHNNNEDTENQNSWLYENIKTLKWNKKCSIKSSSYMLKFGKRCERHVLLERKSHKSRVM